MTTTTCDLAPSPARTGGRNGTVDLVRLLAAAVIVLFHAHAPAGVFMTPAVAAFAAILAYNACKGSASGPAVLARRARRDLQPFAVWLAIFMALRVGGAIHSGGAVLPSLTG